MSFPTATRRRSSPPPARPPCATRSTSTPRWLTAVAALEKANPQKLDLDRLRRLKTDVIISGSHNDELHLKPYTDESKHKTSIKSFKLPFGSEEEGVTGDMGIVIVNNMLLTGFDAPVEQVMYLDKIIVAHSLLQAIARVNRVGGAAKDKGFVVDYVGVGHHLKKALDTYDEREQNEVLDVLSFPEEELRELQASHAAIMDFLKKHGLTDLTDHDAFFDLFYDEDLRFEFMSLFKKFTKCLNLVFPAKEALDFMARLPGARGDQCAGRKALPRRTPEHEGHPAEAARTSPTRSLSHEGSR